MDLAGIPAQTEAELIDGLWAVYNTKLVNSECVYVYGVPGSGAEPASSSCRLFSLNL